MISIRPCMVSAGCRGWISRIPGCLPAMCSWTFGLYFIVQVPWLMSIVTSVPIVSCERCMKWRRTRIWLISGRAGAAFLRSLFGMTAVPLPTSFLTLGSGFGDEDAPLSRHAHLEDYLLVPPGLVELPQ